MKRTGKGMLAALVGLLLLMGCGSTDASREQKEPEQEDRIQIGMSFDSFVIERWQRDRDVFVSMSKELGADVNVQTANGDLEKQKEQIDYFIQKEMDAIVIIAIESEGLKEHVQKAKDAGAAGVSYESAEGRAA